MIIGNFFDDDISVNFSVVKKWENKKKVHRNELPVIKRWTLYPKIRAMFAPNVRDILFENWGTDSTT